MLFDHTKQLAEVFNFITSNTALRRCNYESDGTALNRCGRTTALDTIRFVAGETLRPSPSRSPDDAHVEGTEVLLVTLMIWLTLFVGAC